MMSKTCNLLRRVLSLPYLFCFVRHFRRSKRHPAVYNVVISFHNLVTSKPEEGCFGQPKYCFIKIYYVGSALQ